jgi:hypothetical protein
MHRVWRAPDGGIPARDQPWHFCWAVVVRNGPPVRLCLDSGLATSPTGGERVQAGLRLCAPTHISLATTMHAEPAPLLK